MPEKFLARGAEALIVTNKNKVIKRRVKKSYRLEKLDERLRRQRTRTEARLLERASKLIPTTGTVDVNESKKEISMDFLKGDKLSDNLNSYPLAKQKHICLLIGKNIAKLHDADIIHGDLTTSNMILSGKEVVYFIDFGLGFISKKIEDKAVDLHLLKQALEAKHFTHWETLFKEVINGYSSSKDSKLVLKQLEKVEKRGRYKEQY